MSEQKFPFEKLKEELEIESIEELQTDKLADFDEKINVSKNTNYVNYFSYND